jgi:thioredoxin-related protein
VAKFINENFVPVKIHIKEQPETFKKYGAQWTPTLLVLDPDGTERYRFEGYLPPEEFLSQLELGLAKSAFAREQWKEAEQRYREIVTRYPKTEAASEAQYWAGVSKYKGTGDASALAETAREFKTKYSESAWAKKASVWAA